MKCQKKILIYSTHFTDISWIIYFESCREKTILFDISHCLVLFWKPLVWVALTLLYATSFPLFLPFSLPVLGLGPLAFSYFPLAFFFPLCFNSLCVYCFPFSSFIPFSCLALKYYTPVHADNSLRPSCFHLGIFFFLSQFVVSSSVQVDKHIRRLDADLARFEADLKDKLEGSDFENPGSRSLKSA